MIHKPIRWIKKKFTTVMELQDDKRSIACGVAIGFFWGFTPLLGLKTAFAFLTAWVTRTNKIAAVVAVSLHDILLPFYPLYLAMSYHLWMALMRTDHPLKFKRLIRIIMSPTNELPDDWWTSGHALHYIRETVESYWSNLYHNLHNFLPLLLGSILLAIPLSIGSYFLTLYGIEKLARHQAEKVAALRAAQDAESARPDPSD
jgi:uncharacterized protein (DUF2062 family)